MSDHFLSASQHKYALYGPPASGKSSLIRRLPTLGKDITAIDLELVERDRRDPMLATLRATRFKGPLFVGAADRDYPQLNGFRVILLLPLDKQRYLQNFAERSKREPEKANQDHERYYDLFLKHWGHQLDRLDRCLHIDSLAFASVDEVAKEIICRLQIAP